MSVYCRTCAWSWNQCDQIGRVLKFFGAKISSKKSPNIWGLVGFFEEHHFLSKPVATFWTTFWATIYSNIYSNIWSHWLQSPHRPTERLCAKSIDLNCCEETVCLREKKKFLRTNAVESVNIGRRQQWFRRIRTSVTRWLGTMCSIFGHLQQ